VEDIAPGPHRRPERAQQRRTATAKLLDAAVAQLAHHGVPGLTHRKVEERAGLAQGSVKYYFGSSDGLIESVLTHLADRALPLVLTVAPAERETATAGDLESLSLRAEQVARAMLADSEEVRARLHLYLHAAGDPHLAGLVAAQRERFVAAIGDSLPGPGSAVAARFVCAVVDGILLDQASAPSPVVERHAARYLMAAGATAMELATEPGS